MELKTNVESIEGRQDLLITRDFEISAELLFLAYTDPAIVEQWMGTKVLQLENRKGGGFAFETTDPQGNKYHFSGAIHDLVTNSRIVRTFEFENMSLGVQLELLTFEKLTDDSSRLIIHSIYESEEHRARALKMPFAFGLSMAHNRLEEIMSNSK